MAELYTSADGGGGRGTVTTAADNIDSFPSVRSNASGQYNFQNSSQYANAIASRAYTYGGTSRMSWTNRVFLNFDTSGITVEPLSATLKLYGYSSWSGDIIAIKHSNTGDLNGTNWDLLDGCSSQLAASDGAGTGTLASCATNYSAEIDISGTTSGYNDIALNSTAITDMTNDSVLRIALVDHTHDYLDITPYPSNYQGVGIYFSDYGSTRAPYIDYTPGSVDPVEFNETKIEKCEINIKNSELKINVD